jgi:ligand-binding sensor domain-containing protein
LRQLLSCIFLAMFCLVRLEAQPPQTPVFSHLGTRDGLASDDVWATVQDSKGFIWIASSGGLQRYDGQRFLFFSSKANDPKTLPNNIVRNLILDKKERLWLLCNENKVGYLNTTDLTFHEVPVRFNNKELRMSAAGLFVDTIGNMMLTIAGKTILTYSDAKDEFAEIHGFIKFPEKWKPNHVTYDKINNNYWLGTDSGLVKYNPVKKTNSYRGHNTDNDNIIKAFEDIRYTSIPTMDNEGRFWITSWHPRGPGPFIFSYNTRTGVRTEWEEKLRLTSLVYHEIYNIKPLSDGKLWITGLNLLAYLAPNGKNFQFVLPDKAGEFSIRYDRVNFLSEDRERNIWVSTDKGLFRYNPAVQVFQLIPNKRPGKDSAFTPDVTDILQVKSGEILVSTWGNGLFSYNNNLDPIRIDYVDEAARLNEGLTWCIIQRKNGEIWRGQQDGIIFITDPATRKTRKVQDPIFKRVTIRQLAEDREGNIWIGTHGGTLLKWNDATRSFRIVHQFGAIFRLYLDDKGTLWTATGGTGVYRIDPVTEKILLHYTSDGPRGKKILDPSALDVLQHNDSIYVVASEGLNIINIRTGNVKYFTTENGLPSNSVSNIIKDRNGYLWVTTGSRLCRYNIDKRIISTFNEEDGVPTGTFSHQAAAMLDDGRIAIGRFHDYLVFDPNKVASDNMPAPPVEITGFALMNAWLPMDSLRKLPEVTLRHNENSIKIQFSTLTYLNHFVTEYMMEGMDKDWIATFGVNEVSYNYLPPGTYTFKVRSLSGADLTSAVTSFKISVRTPFWRSWWFYAVLALLAAALFYWEDRERIRRKEALQKMRSDIAGNLHEEINIALNNINVLSEIARLKADKNPEESKTYINEIHQKSHNMIIAMDDMLWSIDPANDSMAKAIDRIKEFADALRHRHNILIHLHTDQKVLMLKPVMKVRHEFLIIHKLALRLLIEELKAPETSIQIDYVRSQLQLSIFSHHVKLQDAGNTGMKMIEEMKKRAASVTALLEFQSDEKGTGIILVVKV